MISVRFLHCKVTVSPVSNSSLVLHLQPQPQHVPSHTLHSIAPGSFRPLHLRTRFAWKALSLIPLASSNEPFLSLHLVPQPPTTHCFHNTLCLSVVHLDLLVVLLLLAFFKKQSAVLFPLLSPFSSIYLHPHYHTSSRCRFSHCFAVFTFLSLSYLELFPSLASETPPSPGSWMWFSMWFWCWTTRVLIPLLLILLSLFSHFLFLWLFLNSDLRSLFTTSTLFSSAVLPRWLSFLFFF